MNEYKAPLEDINFVLNEIANLKKLSEVIDSSDTDPILVKSVLDEAGKFASKILDPINKEGDEKGIKFENGMVFMPSSFIEAYKKFINAGWNSVIGSEKHGGQNLPWTAVLAINEIWQSANMSFANNIMLTQGAIELLEEHGNGEQKKRYLPNMINGKWTGTMNLTEPHAGSDLALIKTKAKPFKDSYKLYGNKIFITHGDQNMSDNIIHLVLARLPDAPKGVKGISLFLVPKKLYNEKNNNIVKNDIRVVSTEHKLGHIASPTCVMAYGDNEGAIGELIGKPNQ